MPHWDLDEKLSSRQLSSASLATLSPNRTTVDLTSTDAPTGTDTTSHLGASQPRAHRTSSGHSSQNRASPSLAQSEDRPAYSQFTEDLDAQEDAGSSAAERDDEVDGVEGAPADTRLRDGRVPQQGQTKEDYTFPRHRLPQDARRIQDTPRHCCLWLLLPTHLLAFKDL